MEDVTTLSYSIPYVVIVWQPRNQGTIQYRVRRLVVRSRKVLKAWDRFLTHCKMSFTIALKFFGASGQYCCREACKISKSYEHFNTWSHDFDTLWDLTIRRLMWYWIGPQDIDKLFWLSHFIRVIAIHAGKIRVHVIGSDLSDRSPNLSEYTKPPSLFLCQYVWFLSRYCLCR